MEGRFHSLQAGKHWGHASPITAVVAVLCFHSLQAGKHWGHLPYFRPTPRLTPQPLIQTRTARGFFLLKNRSENRLNPYQY